MIRYTTGDILSAGTEALVNTVNCVGIMGRGIALQFKDSYPENFKAYASACEREAVQPGRMFVFETGTLTNPKYIINFPTKRHWRGKSRIEDIEAGLGALVDEIAIRRIRTIAIPALGSGLGGLEWHLVRARIEEHLRSVEGIEVVVYEPNGAPDSQTTARAYEVPTMTAGRAALVVLIHRYLAGLLDPVVSLLEVHKLMYFMQEAGQPLKLKYAKAPYGPYAENLRHVLRAIEGHFISGYADDGDAPGKQIQLLPGAVDKATAFLDDDGETKLRSERVAELVEGFESQFGLELLATVHWIATREKVRSASDVVRQVYDWGDRKEQFSPRQIGIALDVLQSKNWTGAPFLGE